MVLLLLVIQVGLTFSLLLWMMGLRQQTLVSGETKISDIAPGQPNWPDYAHPGRQLLPKPIRTAGFILRPAS